jgi:serine/threonine protein kinase
MPNGSLYDHQHGRSQVLLGAARAVEHLHLHAMPLIIHGNIASSNILLDAAWAPRLSGFGTSVWRAAGMTSQAMEGRRRRVV